MKELTNLISSMSHLTYLPVRLSTTLLKTSCLCLFFYCLLATPLLAQERINPTDVTIVRDDWGVPHIYGKTDADASYGLAWAHCEDDFDSIQESLLSINGRSAEVLGKDAAVLDVLVFITNADPVIEKYYDTEVSPAFKKILQAHAQGINDYAKANPKELWIKEIFPITEKDLLKGYLLAQGVISNSVFGIGRLIANNMEVYQVPYMKAGSNAFAFNRHKTKEGATFLVSNTHQPLEGMLGWYEAHVNSEEGWNMLGGTFSTGVSLFLGTNEHLAWTHTTNYPDFHDIYQLKMHPTKKHTYLFDGEWHELEKRVIKFKVKVGFLKIPIRRTFYWSKIGTTIKNKSGYFSVRFPASFSLKAAEQWFLMNKAQNWEEFRTILDMQGLSCQNIMYADKADNIYFLCNGLFPKREADLNWQDIIPGDTSAYVWQPYDYHPVESLPQLFNPESGYLFNCNNPAFSATAPAENLKVTDFEPTMGFLERETNRSLRFQELIKDYEKVSYTDLKTIKYDQQYNSETFYTGALENLNDILKVDAQKYPDLKEVMDIIQQWNRSTAIDNEEATIVMLAVYKILKDFEAKVSLDLANTISEEQFVDGLRWAKDFLLKHYGRLTVPLGDVQRHVRGDVDLPVGGMPEILSAMFVTAQKKGKFKSAMGDSYIQFTQFTKDGVKIESCMPYGACNRPESKHYTDQMELYTQQKLKTMTLDKDKIFEEAVEIYHPGKRK